MSRLRTVRGRRRLVLAVVAVVLPPLLILLVLWLLRRRAARRGASSAAVAPPVVEPGPAVAAPSSVPRPRPRPRRRRRRRWLWLAAAAVLLLALAAAAVLLAVRRTAQTGPETVRVAAVGDMVCDPADPYLAAGNRGRGDRCRHRGVADLAVGMNPTAFLGLGDFQYELPTANAYRTLYGPSYGRLLDRTIPVYGNQEYKVRDANTFTAYFGDRIRDQKGYWSQNIGRWHLVVLNSNCGSVVGGCVTGSPQQTWLEEDLRKNRRPCVLAAWHHPRWSTGIAGPNGRTADLFRTLYDHGVELVLSGHDAHYERFGPLNPAGKPDERGVRQYIVGTGGQVHYRPDARAQRALPPSAPASEFVDYDHHGVLELDLGADSWRWRFHVLGAGNPIEDEGRASCH